MPVATISYLTTVQFGFGALDGLKAGLVPFGERPLLVTDPGIRRAGILDRVVAALGREPAAIFDETPANPTESAARAAAERFRDASCDCIIAVGGGSPIDLAKACALLVSHEGPLEFYAANAGGVPRIKNTMAPVIALPTTSGTGAEVGRAAVIVLDDGRKLGIVSPYLFPRPAICDPELTMGCRPC